MEEDQLHPDAQRDADSRNTNVVWVTGGSRGIGRAIALAFGHAQWRVAVHYRERERDARQVVEEIRERGGDAEVYQGEVRDSGQMCKAATAIVERWHRLDAVICNAGMATSRLLAKTDEDAWDRIIGTNLTGVFYTMRAAAPLMIPSGGGHIIVVGSLAGFQGQAGQAAYATSKSGLVGLARTAAREWGPANLRVNLVLPGWQPTHLAGEAFPEHAGAEHLLGRTPDINEVVRTVFHLARCRDISGQIWNLDNRPFY
ncbi:beta-ketoacyl-ACP reductase [Nitrospira sp.]|nr:beta-ketoacyl-ACP reductase [Nitrospira sp.]